MMSLHLCKPRTHWSYWCCLRCLKAGSLRWPGQSHKATVAVRWWSVHGPKWNSNLAVTRLTLRLEQDEGYRTSSQLRSAPSNISLSWLVKCWSWTKAIGGGMLESRIGLAVILQRCEMLDGPSGGCSLRPQSPLQAWVRIPRLTNIFSTNNVCEATAHSGTTLYFYYLILRLPYIPLEDMERCTPLHWF